MAEIQLAKPPTHLSNILCFTLQLASVAVHHTPHTHKHSEFRHMLHLEWLSKLEVQYEEDGEDEGRNDAADDPLVPVHPLGHGSQDLLAFADVVIHTMQGCVSMQQ